MFFHTGIKEKFLKSRYLSAELEYYKSNLKKWKLFSFSLENDTLVSIIMQQINAYKSEKNPPKFVGLFHFHKLVTYTESADG